ncbi:DUF6616 family protein [Agarilytica rhodophyticola]|uniref:DUF6616 family protein n=1 Tax=Agarilytica rhodophyticola TaxID=1737490 RepID=UPI000B345EF7|nr:DUF6616 family protein [Agarilytica rhodophyticola]
MSTEHTQLYIELYNYKPAWFELTQEERENYVDIVSKAIAEMETGDVNVIGFGYNDSNTDRRAKYDFFCVYTMPNTEFARAFEEQVKASGWYNYFDQVNISGPQKSYAVALADNAQQLKPEAQ